MRIAGKSVADPSVLSSVPAKTAVPANRKPESRVATVSHDPVSLSPLGKALQQRDDSATAHTPLRVAREIPAGEVASARSRRASAAYRVTGADDVVF